jgi:hypothetical protein
MSSRSVRTSSTSGLGFVNSPPPNTSSTSSSTNLMKNSPLSSANKRRNHPKNPFGAQFTYSPAGGQGWVSSDILKFAVFSRDLSPNDEDATGEELSEPVLYFYPSDISPHDRVKFMNTVLGLGDFMRNFSSKDKITSVHFDRSRVAIYECEPNIYFVLEVSSPQRRMYEDEREHFVETNGTDDENDVLHASDEASDALLRRIVCDSYELYRLFRGNINDMLMTHPHQVNISPLRKLQNCREEKRKAIRDLEDVENGDLNQPEPRQMERIRRYESGEIDEELALLASQSPAHGVRKALRTLIPVYIDGIDFSQLHFFHELDGFTFFPVPHDIYMNVHSFVTSIETSFSQVKQVSMTYNGRLIWSTMDQHHSRLILRFVRYHEMIGDASKKKVSSFSSHNDEECGFMSTIRGIWVQAEVPPEEEEDGDEPEADENEDKKDKVNPVKNQKRNPELQIFAPPVLLRRPPVTNKKISKTTTTGEGGEDEELDLATVPIRGARSLTA